MRAHRPAIVSQPLSWDRISTITRGADITDILVITSTEHMGDVAHAQLIAVLQGVENFQSGAVG